MLKDLPKPAPEGTFSPSATPVSNKRTTGGIVSNFLAQLFDRCVARAEIFVAGGYWMFEVLLAAVLFAVLFSGGIDRHLYDLNDTYSGGYFDKIAHPLADTGKLYPASKHDAKLNFRLTVPVVLHLLHVPPGERWVLPVLTTGAICCVLLFSCLFVFQATGDRVSALFITLATASIYIGSFGFTRYYDAIAIAQLTLAMLPRLHPAFKGLLVFTAAFTDERALLASPLLLAQVICRSATPETDRPTWRNPESLAIVGGMLAYICTRLALARLTGLSSPMGDVGADILLNNAPFWHAGAWFALKGGWMLVALAFFSLWLRRRFVALAIFSAAVCAVVGSGFLVLDVLRSTSYVYPALLVAVAILGETENLRSLRMYCLIAFLISAAAGNYNVWMGQITWFKPLAARFLEHLLSTALHAA